MTWIAVSRPDRALISVTGRDARTFLQGLVTQDMAKVTATRSVYAALLSAQGKFLYDFFILPHPDDDAGHTLNAAGQEVPTNAEISSFILDCPATTAEDLLRRLQMYRLRSAVELRRLPAEWSVTHLLPAATDDSASNALQGLPETLGGTRFWHGGILTRDPRHPAMGLRVVLPRAFDATMSNISEQNTTVNITLNITPGTGEDYTRHRLQLGIPEGEIDAVIEKTLLLELGFEALGGVDFAKGCYVGQELTARTKYRALLKKCLHQVESASGAPLPPLGTPIMQNGQEVGELRSSLGTIGLAMLRLEAAATQPHAPLTAAATPLTAHLPAWMPQPAANTDSENS